MGRSAEEMPAVYEDIGKAIQGQTRGLRSIGVVLSDYEQRVVKMNAMMGDYRANAVIIAREIERQHGGAAAAFMRTPGGLAAKEAADMLSMKAALGDPMRTLLQLAQITVDKLVLFFFGPIAKNAEQLNQFLLSHWKQWVAYVDRYLVPAFKRLVDQGWKYLIQIIKYFRENSTWLLPFLKNVAIGFGAWTMVIHPLIGVVTTLLNPLNLVILAIGAIGLAIWKARTDWLGFRRMLEGMGDWLLGTKFLDPKNRGYGPGVLRAFPKGVVPRAMPVQQGWVRQTLQAFAEQFAHWSDYELPPLLERIGQSVLAWMREQGPAIGKWIDDLIASQRAALLKFFDPMIESAKRAVKAIQQIFTPLLGWQRAQEHAREFQKQYVHEHPNATPAEIDKAVREEVIRWEAQQKALQDSTDSLKSFNKQIDIVTGNDLVHFTAATDDATEALAGLAGLINQLQGGGGGGPGAPGTPSAARTGGVYNPLPMAPLKSGAYPLNYRAAFEAAGAKYGVDPVLLAAISGFETGGGTSRIFRQLRNVGGITGPGYSGAGGRYQPFPSVEASIMREAQLIASYRDKYGLRTIEQIGSRWAPPGAFNDPNRTNAEWPRSVRAWYMRIQKSWNHPDTAESKPNITLHYNPTLHFHGIEDEIGLHSRLASHHRRAMDQFQRMLTEATYMRNRAAYAGAAPV
jgi:hypothetical protein